MVPSTRFSDEHVIQSNNKSLFSQSKQNLRTKLDHFVNGNMFSHHTENDLFSSLNRRWHKSEELTSLGRSVKEDCVPLHINKTITKKPNHSVTNKHSRVFILTREKIKPHLHTPFTHAFLTYHCTFNCLPRVFGLLANKGKFFDNASLNYLRHYVMYKLLKQLTL